MSKRRKKTKAQQIKELKTKICGGHKSGYQPALVEWEKELLEKYGIHTKWVKKRDAKYCPYWKPSFSKVRKKKKKKNRRGKK